MDISIILPVYHEEKIIKSSIERLRNALNKTEIRCEIIVSDGDPGGGTLNSLKGEKIIHVRSKTGRGAQMNSGANAAKGNVLLFLHADSILPAGAFEKILAAMSNPGIAGGAFSLTIDSGHWFLRAASIMTNIRCKLNRIPYGDQAIFIKRSIFNQLGGFAEIPVMEEVDLMLRIRQKGLHIAILKDKVKTSARLWEKDGIFYTTFRNRMISLFYSLGIKPEKIARFYQLRIN